jgi:tetratricopeptide (TPR) repeat protein
MPETMDTRLSRLRERAERALASGRRGGEVLTVLETMTREAPDGSAHALFAHRHLAELQLSGSPWRAALHLRRLVQAGAADDSAHALMGLSQALLGNYRMAVAAYRRAIKLAPRNPWYHHNLGHLLDVGLSESVAALDHLRIAQRIQPEEDEITASLAHCLARLGQLKEAQHMAQRAVRRAPRNREHQALLEWIKSGAPSNVMPSARPERSDRAERTERAERKSSRPAQVADEPSAPAAQPKRSSTPAQAARPALKAASRRADMAHTSNAASLANTELSPALTRVLTAIETHSAAPGGAEDGAQYMKSARSLWVDFCTQRQPRVQKPAVYAAAVEYTLSKLARRTVTQAELARRYGVTARAIAARYEEIRQALALEPGDTRYLGRTP